MRSVLGDERIMEGLAPATIAGYNDEPFEQWALVVGDLAGSQWMIMTTRAKGEKFLEIVRAARESSDDPTLGASPTVQVEGWCNTADRAPRTVQFAVATIVSVDFYLMCRV